MTDRTDRIPFGKAFREKQLWILVAIGILYFYRPLFLETFYFRDLFTFHLPQKNLFASIVKNGELPLWDPFVHGGQPFLARINNGALYPFNVLYLFLPLLTALNVDLVLHVIFCAVSAYLLARILNLEPAAAMVVGLIYGFCGHTLSHLNLGARLQVLPYFPMLILFWHLYLLEANRKWLALSVMAGVLPILAGAVEMVLISFPFLLGWTLVYPYSEPLRARVFRWGMLSVFVLTVASVELIPAMEVASHSSRSGAVDHSQFTTWSLNPRRLPEIVIPDFIGFRYSISQSDYWGKAIEDPPSPFVISIYFGLLAMALAFAGATTEYLTNGLNIRFRRFLLVVAAAGILLSLGRFLPYFRIFESVPVIHSFRFPIKIWNVVILPVALLSGCGMQAHFDGRFRPSSVLRISWWILAGLLAVFWVAFNASEQFAASFQRFFFGSSNAAAQKGLSRAFLHAAAIWLLVSLLFEYRRIRTLPFQQWGMVAILGLDLLVAGMPVNSYAPRDLFAEPESVKVLRENIGAGRLYRVASAEVSLRAPSDDLIWGYRWDLETLNHNLGALFGIPLFLDQDIDRLTRTEMAVLKREVELLPWDQKMPLLTAGAVSLILTTEQAPEFVAERLAVIPNSSTTPLYLYRNKVVHDRAWFVFNSISVASREAALQKMRSAGFDPKQVAVIQEGDSLNARNQCRSKVVEVQSSYNFSAHSVANDCAGYLIYSEPYDRGWRTSVDGKAFPAVRANYVFTGVFLKPGEHRVERSYLPNSVVIGAVVSFFGLLILVAFCRTRRWAKGV